MTTRRLAATLVAALGAAGCRSGVLIVGQTAENVVGTAYPYRPAALGTGAQAVDVFGPREQMAPLPPLPFSPSPRLSSDGRSLYAFDIGWPSDIGRPNVERRGLFRIDLETMKVNVVPGSRGLEATGDKFTVSADGRRVILSGVYGAGGISTCGLFEFRPGRPGLDLLVENEDCQRSLRQGPPLQTLVWTSLSLSPDGARVVADSRRGLQVIDLPSRTVRLLGDFAEGEWSPDGRWLSVVDTDFEHTYLLDAATLRREREFGVYAAHWSPDSRYLLYLTLYPCGAYWYTVGALDVAGGKRGLFASSSCRVNRLLGWTHWRGSPSF